MAVANPYWDSDSAKGKKREKQVPRTYSSKAHYDQCMADAPATKLKTLIDVLKYHLSDDSVPPVTVDVDTHELQFGARPADSEPSRTRKILVFIAWTMMTPAFETVRFFCSSQRVLDLLTH